MKKRVFLIFLFSIILCNYSLAQNWNINSASTINKWNIHGASKTFSTSTSILTVGIPTSMVIYSLIKKDNETLKNAVYIGTSVIEAAGVSWITKHIVNEKRPYVKYPDKITLYGGYDDSPSFPSSHAATAFALATSLSITYPKWWVIAPSAAWACGVGIARVNQGKHYPGDVMTGAVIGIGCGFANVYINRWLNRVLIDKVIK